MKAWLIVGFWALFGFFSVQFILAWMRTHRLVLKESLKDYNQSQVYWCYESTDKSGNKWWKSVFWQPKVRVQAPPNNVLEVTTRGRKFAHAYLINKDKKGLCEVVWNKDSGLKKESVLTKDDVKFMVGYQPFTATDRKVLSSEYKKAEEQKRKGFMRPEFVLPFTAIMVLAVIVISLFVFWGDIAKPALDSHRIAQNIQGQNVELVNSVNSISNNLREVAKALGVKIQDLKDQVELKPITTVIGESEKPPTDNVFTKAGGLITGEKT